MLSAFVISALNIRRVGGLTHFRVGRFGGSFYVKRAAPKVHRAVRETAAGDVYASHLAASRYATDTLRPVYGDKLGISPESRAAWEAKRADHLRYLARCGLPV
jgi:hypothetical protein